MKLYVDSRYRTADSPSGSDFTIELLESIELPDRCRCRVTNLTVPFSWWTVEEGNRFLYFSERFDNTESYRVAILPLGQYDGPRLATAIRDAMRTVSIWQADSTISVQYSDQRGTITISVLNGQNFTLYDDITLRGITPWLFSLIPGATGTALQPRSFNRNLRITSTQMYQTNVPYTSEFVDLLGIKTLYLTSNSLGSLGNVGPRIGQRSTLASMPVTSSFGYVNVQDPTGGELQDFEVGGQTLKRVQFRLEDASGVVVPLHGLDISFTMSFDIS